MNQDKNKNRLLNKESCTAARTAIGVYEKTSSFAADAERK